MCVECNELGAVRCDVLASKTISASNIEYVVEPTSLCVIFSNTEALWCSWMMAMIKSLGSR